MRNRFLLTPQEGTGIEAARFLTVQRLEMPRRLSVVDRFAGRGRWNQIRFPKGKRKKRKPVANLENKKKTRLNAATS